MTQTSGRFRSAPGSGENYLIYHTKGRPGAKKKPPLIFCHGFGASLAAQWEIPAYKQLWASLAKDYVVGIADLGFPMPGGPNWDRWGNRVARDRVDILRALMEDSFGARRTRLGLVGVSMGGGLALNWAYNKGPKQCAFVAAISPMIHIPSLRVFNGGVLKANIDRAYSNPYSEAKDGPRNSPYHYKEKYDADKIPTAIWTANNDPVVLPRYAKAFVEANPKIEDHDVGPLGHTVMALAAATPGVVAFAHRMKNRQYR